MGMFTNVGHTLSLLRELRGKSQSLVAREAGIGKSQLSKYENGKELPKLDSLEKVLAVLEVGHFEFFYTLHLVDRRADQLSHGAAGPAAADSAGPDPASYLPPLPKGHPMGSDTTDQAFAKVFADLLILYRRIFEQIVFTRGSSRT
jgi:transcriptional regulator with XRE-family HTH domain